MTKKELIEELKQNMPQGLSELEIARYVYIKLGEKKAFDTKFFYGNSKMKNKIYISARKTDYNTEEVAQKRTIICVSISYLLRDILKEFGIESIVVNPYEGDKHTRNIIQLSDGRRIQADLQVDLQNIQSKMKTQKFGTLSSYDKLDKILNDKYKLKIVDRKTSQMIKI